MTHDMLPGAEDALREALVDVVTHRSAWRDAIILARDFASEGSENPDADRSYWNRELRAYDRTFATLQSPRASDEVLGETSGNRCPSWTGEGRCPVCGCLSASPVPGDAGDAMREALVKAYAAGAEEVHSFWKQCRPDVVFESEPDFTEAASDYGRHAFAELSRTAPVADAQAKEGEK
jgi:hypothetical protein